MSRTGVLTLAAFLTLVGAGCKPGNKKPDAGPTGPIDGPFGYRLNAGHTGAVDGTLKTPLRKRWIARLGGTLSYPIVTKTGVFVIEAGTQIQLRSFDLNTGAALWPSVNVEGSETSVRAAHLAYENGVLFAANDKGLVTAVDAATGATLWATSIKGTGGQFSWPPLAADGKVYVPGFGLTGYIAAVNQETGSFLWATTAGNSDSTPAYGEGRIHTAYKCASGSAFDAHSGALAWTETGDCTQNGIPFTAYDDGIAYLGTAVGDKSEGSRVDRNGVVVGGVESRTPIAVHNGHFITLMTTQPHTFKSVDPGDTNITWMDTDADDVQGPPIIVNGQVFSAAADGTVKAVDELTGALLWTDNVGSGIHLGKSATEWGDLGSNGDVLVIPTLDGLTVYETDPAGAPLPDDAYKSYCDTNNVAFHVEGTTSRRTTAGTKLNDGALLFEGVETLEATSDVTAVWTTLSNPTDYQSITISTGSSTMPNWNVEFSTRNALQPLSLMAYPTANVRSSYDDIKLGAARLKMKRTDTSNQVICDDGNGSFEFTGMTSNGAGLLTLKGNFVYHCNQEAASIRGCFRYQP